MNGSLLDKFLPEYHVRSAHETLVTADIATTYRALCTASFRDSAVVRMLLWLRSLGKALPPRPADASLFRDLKAGGFLELAADPEREMVFGLAGKFWLPQAERVALASANEFRDFCTLGYAKAAWNLSLEAVTPTTTRLRTQTRILCFGSVRWKFRLYWGLVGPFSGLTRIVLLRQVKRKAEESRSQAARV